MIYQGSKARLLKDILPYIQDCIDQNGITNYVEPFVGGANVIDSVKAQYRTGCDNNKELIALLEYMRTHPSLEIFPDNCPFEHYKEVREDRKQAEFYRRFPTEYIAGIGYFASYGGRYFDGGYGRDATGKRNIYAERLRYAREQAPKFAHITFKYAEYNRITDITEHRGAIVYCDPPYKGTKVYDGKGGFNYEDFYTWLRWHSHRHFILVSEYQMPDDFVCVWEKERKVYQKSGREKTETATERLYTLRGGLYDDWLKKRG